MARAKRWTVPFMSLNGTSCHVDIYDEGWTGSVTTLTGAANPFYYEEDNDEDLLNGVIRYRTGYLRIVEDTYGALNDLYPSTNTERYIEFYYGNNLDFVGFIMAQEFEKEWAPGPRVIELPVTSPLGLAYGTTLDWTQFVGPGNIPQWLTIRQMLNLAFSALNVVYNGWYFPKYHSQTGNGIVMDCLYLNTLVPVPFGKYNKTSPLGDLTGIYDPKTVGELLETICTGFGVILHEGIGTPVFQRIDWYGDYILFGMTSTSTPVSQGLTDLTSISEVASAENIESVIQPISRIEVTYDGSDDIKEMTMNRCKGYDRPSGLDGYELCTNEPNISDFDGTFATQTNIDIHGQITEGIVMLAALGSGSLSEMILFRKASNWEIGKWIASYTFFDWWGYDVRLRFTFRYGPSVDDMNNPSHSEVSSDFYAKISVKVVTDTTTLASEIWTDGRTECELSVPSYLRSAKPLRVDFYCRDTLVEWVHAISDVHIEKHETASNAYLERELYPNEYTVEGTPSFTQASITRGCGVLCYNTNRIRIDESVVTGTVEVEIWNNDPQYPYLTQAQDRLQVDIRTASYQELAAWYMNMYTLWSSDKKWRCIARSFTPWDDKLRMTFHHSPIFDTNESTLSVFPSAVDLPSDGSTGETITVISNTNYTIE